MDIRLKALLGMFSVLGAAFAGVAMVYAMTMFLSDAVIFGIIIGALVGFTLYNLYRMFLAIEEMKERYKK